MTNTKNRAARVLIVAFHFPPSEAIGARRPAALFKFLEKHGYDVRALTHEALPTIESEGAPTHKIISVGAGRFTTLRQVVAGVTPSRRRPGRERIAPVRPAGRVQAFAAARSGMSSRLKFFARELIHIPDSSNGWILPAIRRYQSTVGGWRPDVIIASGPPFSTFLAAAMIARITGAPWIADYRDLWTAGNEYWGFGESRVRKVIDRWMERRLVSRAHSHLVVSEPQGESLMRAFKVCPTVIMNGIDSRDVHRAPPRMERGLSTRFHTSRSTITLVHTGVIYPGRRDPAALLEAMSLLGADRDRVTFKVAGPGLESVLAAAQAAGVEDRVVAAGNVSVEESWRMQRDADILVLLMWNDPRDAGTVPGKLFDYLSARRPIMMLGQSNGVVPDLLRRSDSGVVLSSPAEIVEQLKAWLKAKDTLGSISDLPSSALEGLSREEQLEKILPIIESLVGAEQPVR